MIEALKEQLNTLSPMQQKGVLAGVIASAVLMIGIAGFTGYTVVANTVAFNDHHDVTLDADTTDAYIEQMLSVMQYDNFEGMRISDTYEHRGLLYVHVFDGYADDIFVFKDDTLYALGSSVTSDLLLIEDL